MPKVTSTNERRYPDREPDNRIGGSFLEGSSYSGTAFQDIFSGSPSNVYNPCFSWYLYDFERLS